MGFVSFRQDSTRQITDFLSVFIGAASAFIRVPYGRPNTLTRTSGQLDSRCVHRNARRQWGKACGKCYKNNPAW